MEVIHLEVLIPSLITQDTFFALPALPTELPSQTESAQVGFEPTTRGLTIPKLL